jgi:hypothetical protein
MLPSAVSPCLVAWHMLQQRYPYRSVGVIAGVVVGVFSAAYGWLLASHVPGNPSPVVTAVIAAAFGVAAGFIVFSSEAERRPPSLWQAALADGIISGMIAWASAALLISLFSGGAGSGSGPSGGSVLRITAASAGLGVIGGGVAGMVTWLIAGEARLKSRVPPPPSPRKRPNKGRRSKGRR